MFQQTKIPGIANKQYTGTDCSGMPTVASQKMH